MGSGDERETCDDCGFDSSLYNRADTITSQRFVPAVLAAAVEGLEVVALGVRPDPTTWSIAEYLDHVREVAFGNRFAIESGLAEPGIDLGSTPDQPFNHAPKNVDVHVALAGVSAEFEALQVLLSGLNAEQWASRVTLGDRWRPVGWFARHVLHDGFHHLGDIGRIRHGLGLGASTMIGSVEGLHVSNGGVPKRPIERARIGPQGVAGDTQSDRRHHGRPAQAVCLWGADVIGQLQAEGHAIEAGNAGENITISGVAWADIRPGTRVDVGPLRLLISAHAIPCAKNAQWFSDRDFNRIHHERHPGSSRLYAIPLNSGTVTLGDQVVVEP